MRPRESAQLTVLAGRECGFTLLETLFVLLVVCVMIAIATPSTKSALQNYDLSAAVKSISGAIQSTRYLAIMKGYPYNVAFTQGSSSYQIGAKVPPAATFSNSGNAVPWSVTNDVILSPSTTLQFSPGGTVTATTGGLVFTLTGGTAVETITVSSVGDVSVNP